MRLAPSLFKQIIVKSRQIKKFGAEFGDIAHSNSRTYQRKLSDNFQGLPDLKIPSAIVHKLCFSLYDRFGVGAKSYLTKVSPEEALQMFHEKYQYEVDPKELSDKINRALHQGLTNKIANFKTNDDASIHALNLLNEVYQDLFANVSLSTIAKKLVSHMSLANIDDALKLTLTQDIAALHETFNEFSVLAFQRKLKQHIQEKEIENSVKVFLLSHSDEFFKQLQLAGLPDAVKSKTKLIGVCHELPQALVDEMVTAIDNAVKSTCELEKAQELQNIPSIDLSNRCLCITTEFIQGKPALSVFDIFTHHTSPENSFEKCGQEVLPIRGIGKIAAIAKVLNDIDWLGVEGFNVYLTYDEILKQLSATIVDVGGSFAPILNMVNVERNLDTKNIFFAVCFEPFPFDCLPEEFKSEFLDTLIELSKLDLDELFKQHFIKKNEKSFFSFLGKSDDLRISKQAVAALKGLITNNLATVLSLYRNDIELHLGTKPDMQATP